MRTIGLWNPLTLESGLQCTCNAQGTLNGDGPVNYKLLNLVVLGRYENTSNYDSDSLVGWKYGQ